MTPRPAAMENLLGITDPAELAREEERLSKIRALELFDRGRLGALGAGTPEVGTFAGLAVIHGHLFQDVYEFAGRMRDVDISKRDFLFAPARHLGSALAAIDGMPWGTFDEIVEKYVEMNVAHPFREGNGRACRIWLDGMLRAALGRVVEWGLVGEHDYMHAMERSPVTDGEIKSLLRGALTGRVGDRRLFADGVDVSYRYEGLGAFKAIELP